jgi:DNA-binding GntR family transcriptional regulator
MGQPEHVAVAASPSLAARLDVDEGAPLLLERVEMLAEDGTPSHLRSTYTVEGQTGRRARRVVRSGARAASSEEAHLLGVATGALLLVVQSTWYSPKSVPVEAIDLLLPADRWLADMGY